VRRRQISVGSAPDRRPRTHAACAAPLGAVLAGLGLLTVAGGALAQTTGAEAPSQITLKVVPAGSRQDAVVRASRSHGTSAMICSALHAAAGSWR
jgi:hypothetical protein